MKLSIIYIIESPDYFNSIKNLIKFGNETQLILINKIENIEIENNLHKYLKEEDVIINAYDKSLWECIKLSSNYINSEYVMFSFSEITFSKNCINKITNAIEKDSANLYFIKNKKNIISGENEVALSDTNCIITSVFSYVFRYFDIEKLNLIDICDTETSTQLVIELIAKYKNIKIINDCILDYSTTTFEKKYANCKNWYVEALEKIYLPLAIKYRHNLYIEKIIYYSIYLRFIVNKNGGNKEILFGEEKDYFFSIVAKILDKIGEKTICSMEVVNNKKIINYDFKYMMLYLKNKNRVSFIDFDENGIYNKIGDNKVYFESSDVTIDAMNIKNNELLIDASFQSIQLYDFDKKSIIANINDKRVIIKRTEVYSLTKYFATSFAKKYTFQISVPLDETVKKISFLLNLNGKILKMGLSYPKVHSRLVKCYKSSYWNYKGYMIKENSGVIIVKKSNFLNIMCSELLFFVDIIINSKPSYKIKTLFLRSLYWLLKPLNFRKRIWIYFDKLYKAGDNGEYLVKYASNIKDSVKHYYVINGNSYDYSRLKKEGVKLLKFNSIKHKLMCLYAENIIATHPDIIKFCGFGKNLQKSFRGLFNANIICIAHGLTIQKNAEVQNRLYDNTMFYTTSSKYEVAHITRPIYGYANSQTALTGLARFDRMISNDKKIILITPTWRRSVSGVGNVNEPKGYNPNFKNTAYFKIYNDLINDERLLLSAKEKGYSILFLLHPAMSSQISDYYVSESVTILQATDEISYEKILSEASIMVTDYSGIQYDFAYMKKPIVYYHSRELPPRFEEGALNYMTMGFGAICKSNEEVVDELVSFIRNDCKNQDKYLNRINDFFKFEDRKNCNRIYESIIKFTDDNR